MNSLEIWSKFCGRKVEILKYEFDKNHKRKKVGTGKFGVFIAPGLDNDEDVGGSFSTAIVLLQDNTFDNVYIELVKFVGKTEDRPIKFEFADPKKNESVVNIVELAFDNARRENEDNNLITAIANTVGRALDNLEKDILNELSSTIVLDEGEGIQ